MKPMIFTILLVAVVFACGCLTDFKVTAGEQAVNPLSSAKIVVSDTVTQSDGYRGGMKPTPERLKQLTAPRPFAGKRFHVIRGSTNTVNRDIVLTFTTSETGTFAFTLPPGTYSLLVDEQVPPPDCKPYRSQSISVDEAAFNQWWEKPYYLLEVNTADIVELKFHFHHRPFISNDIPCLRYTGPYPP